MNVHFSEFLEYFSPQLDPILPPQTRLKDFKGNIPTALIDFWAKAGWSGYAEGIFWSTDPAEFSPVVEAWLGDSALLKHDLYSVVARSAFGKLFLWGKESGMSLIIDPHFSSITTVESNFKNVSTDAQISGFFLSSAKDDFDCEDIK